MQTLQNLCVLIIVVALSGCSLALDMDALQKGTKKDNACTDNSECDDGIDCTDDVCSSNKTCVYLPQNSKCEYMEICNPKLGCVASGDECVVDKDCDDKVDCTKNACVLGKCKYTPNNDLCESDNLCIVGEVCDAVKGCLPGKELACGLSEKICNIMKCDPSVGECKDYLMETADNDNDTYLDEICGGDDCNDEDDTIHPGAVDICDGIDNNCDSIADLTVLLKRTEVATGISLVAPSVAAGNDNYVVTWQLNEASSTAVYARFLNKDGTMACDGHNFSSVAGTGASGFFPSVVAGEDAFYVAWSAQDSSLQKSAWLIPLTLDNGTKSVQHGTAVTLSTGTLKSIAPVEITWDSNLTAGDKAWVAAWSSEQLDGTKSVHVQTPDMGDTSFAVASSTDNIDEVSIAVAGKHDYVIAYSKLDTTGSGDMEIFESNVQLSGSSTWENMSGYPHMISASNAGETDPSTHPKVASYDTDSWVIVYNDATDDTSELDDDLMAWNGTSNTTIIDGVGGFIEDTAWTWSGSGFGLLYVKHAKSTGDNYVETLNFIPYGANLSAPSKPYAPPMLLKEPVTYPERDISDATISSNGSNGFIAAWIETDDNKDSLIFTAFKACQAK